MNYFKAIKILDLDKEYSEKQLKRNYYIKALEFHPDKNNGVDDKFKEIVEAYEYLQREKEVSDIVNDGDNYIKLMNDFIDFILDKNLEVNKFISSLNNKYTKVSFELLEKFSKKTLVKINNFVKTYGDVLSISDDVKEKINKLIDEYTKNDKIEIINPTLENLLNDEIYQFEYNNEIYYIPLWHQELEYELNKDLLIVQCQPVLPECIEIDENNNLNLLLVTELKEIMNDEKIIINIANKSFDILVNKLLIKKYQRYTIIGKGISLINTKDIYNIDYRANINIDIHFKDII